MQQFLTLIKKELRIYFSGLSAYFLIYAYLCATFGSAFYFGGYLAEKNETLYSLFSSQPYILILIIPAVTMRLWAEEYKTNSAEFLLTLPIKPLKIIAAKFCFSAGFFVALTIGILPFIIYTAIWQKLDWLNIFSAYIGLWMLIIMLCALGSFISSLSKNLIIAYVLNLFVLIPSAIISQTNLISTYHNFLFAEVGFFDLYYFSSFAFLFLFLNLKVIEYRRNLQKNSMFLFSIMSFSAIIANILICWGLHLADYKLDLTSGKLYSLKTPTKHIIEQIKTPTQIDLYIAEDFYKYDYPAAHYFEQVSRFLNKYQQASKGMIQVSAVKVQAFSDKENELINQGFYSLKNSTGSKNYFGAIIKNKDNETQVIKQFIPERQAFLEEDVDRAILKSTFPELKKNIGVYLDASQNLDNYEGAGLILENEYNTMVLNNNSYQIRNTADAVILFNPKELSSVFLYALDQYVMNGGKLIVFLDRKTDDQFDNINDEPIALMRLLNNWQIELGGEPFENGKLAKFQNKMLQPLAFQSAYDIRVKNKNLNIVPLITKEKHNLGVLINGELKSYYHSNPFADTPIGEYMHPFKLKTDSAQIAIIGDADILNEKNWIAENSPDRDIYGAIEKAGNGQFLKYLVDYMVGNEIYLLLPKNQTSENFSSISEKIKTHISNADAQEYEKIQSKANDLAVKVWILAGYKAENVKQILDISEEGRVMQALTEEMNNIDYNRASRYNRLIMNLMIFFILVLPLLESLLAFLLFSLWKRCKTLNVKELLK